MWTICGELSPTYILIKKIHAYLYSTQLGQESMFQISSQSLKPFNLDVGEPSNIESKKYYIDLFGKHIPQ